MTIMDLSPFTYMDLKSLIQLDLGNNQINDLSPLQDLTSLENLYIYQNLIQEISPLQNLNLLNHLNLFDNLIKSIPKSSNGLLWMFHLIHNDISGAHFLI